MYEAQFRLQNGRLVVKVSAPGQKELFEALACVQEVCDEKACGQCGSDDVRFSVRTVEDNKFYELVCNGCAAKLAMGQHKKGGTLFPKRTVKDGDREAFDRKHRGWHHYVPPRAEEAPKEAPRGKKG